MDQFVESMDAAGVERGVIGLNNNDRVGEILKEYPDRFIGFAKVNPFDGMRAVREVERLVREEGFAGLDVTALHDLLPANDRRYYPLYAKCVELNIPVRVYAGMSFANDRAYDLGHPRYLDDIAVDFPELRIVAQMSGWPWVSDMVGLLRRHPNLYCDTAAHRPRHFSTPGSGWEMFLQFGDTLLRDKVMVGLSWGLMGLSMSDLIDEYLALPLRDETKQKWLYGNAAEFFGLNGD